MCWWATAPLLELSAGCNHFFSFGLRLGVRLDAGGAPAWIVGISSNVEEYCFKPFGWCRMPFRVVSGVLIPLDRGGGLELEIERRWLRSNPDDTGESVEDRLRAIRDLPVAWRAMSENGKRDGSEMAIR